MSIWRILIEPTPRHPNANALRALLAIVAGFWIGVGIICGMPWWLPMVIQ